MPATISFEDIAIQSPARNFLLPEKAIIAYFEWLPVLWLCGLILPAAFILTFGTFVLYVRSRRAIAFALPWFAVGTAQYISVIINWVSTSDPPTALLKHLFASYVSGWFLLGAAIGIGASGIIQPSRMLRCVVRLADYNILFAIAAYVLAFSLQRDSLFILSPIGYLIPASFLARNFSFGIFCYNWEDLGGSMVPRLSIFAPWPTAMGVAGVCMVFIGMNINDKRHRTECVVAGILMVIASVGRLAVLVLIICLLVRWLCSWKSHYRIVVLCTALSMAAAGVLLIQPGSLIDSFIDRFNEARPGASDVRNDVYAANWEGFYESPVIGHGWPGEFLVDHDNVFDTGAGMIVGSHSTVSGLLYKGGLITFALFLFAFVFTSSAILRYSEATSVKNNLMILLCIGITCFAEGLESLVLPTLFVFFWLGISLANAEPNEDQMLKMEI